ncbi:beta-lactamase domain-containing protein [Liquorilactobacillus aquaticus DSM 21051]|uniref:Beta-lactamase domain-containing protein n=1 Tax=Liquorilactobacillus aquaticus DSM 21051 TaxID=1423725 RepID=A0A0R2D1T4_9LACO|nr:MBL fold metallo-hydrolase [Liquorilactobacillus aquaticus]KRM95828.1 beta-lactamase domain-containing protein [Liquorilactobacillus aquaticus DSM 21051]
MKITILGFLGGYPYNGQATSCYLIQSKGYNLLLDCGSGALLNLEKHLDPLDLDAVLLSHYHNDHIADIGVLQYYWQLNNSRIDGKVLPIYGHKQDKKHFDDLTWDKATIGQAYEPSKKLLLGPFEISFLKTKHPVTAYAVKIEDTSDKKIFAFTADTDYIPELTAFVRGADVLMTDTNYSAGKKEPKWHMTSTESGKLAKDAAVKKLILTHLPQKEDLNLLLEEAKEAATKSIEVDIAETGKIITC